MRSWSKAQFDDVAAGASLLASDEHGPKVLLTPDQRVIKLFRRKRVFSSAWLWPYAQRFERASRELAKRSVPAAIVEQVARVPHLARDVVIYRHLDGRSLREALAQPGLTPGEFDRLLLAFTHSLATLHQRGVYFRAAHFGNFLVPATRDADAAKVASDDAKPPPPLSLIDISEARFRRRPLAASLRARNLRPLCGYAEDRQALRRFGVDRFLHAYAQACACDASVTQRLRAALANAHADFAH